MVVEAEEGMGKALHNSILDFCGIFYVTECPIKVYVILSCFQSSGFMHKALK